MDPTSFDRAPAMPERAPAATPVGKVRLRPLTTLELSRYAKTGHARCGSSGGIVTRAAGTKPGDKSEQRGLCTCSYARVQAAITAGKLRSVGGKLLVVELLAE